MHRKTSSRQIDACILPYLPRSSQGADQGGQILSNVGEGFARGLLVALHWSRMELVRADLMDLDDLEAEMAEGNKVMKYLGIGCAFLFVLGGAVLIGVSFFGYREYKKIEEDMAHPEPRAQRILGYETLPDGYYVTSAFSIPAVNDIVILSDVPRKEEETKPQLGERGFVYTLLKLPFTKQENSEGLNDFFAGRTNDTSVLKDNQINMDLKAEDIVNRGVIEVHGATVRFIATSEGISGEHGKMKGLTTLMLMQCGEDKRLRFGIWNTGIMPKEGEDGSLDYSGTVADEAELSAFLNHFQFCGAAEK